MAVPPSERKMRVIPGPKSRALYAAEREFLAPGMQHCFGGPGPSAFGQFERSSAPNDPQHNVYGAIEQWVEKGVAPDKLIATQAGNASKMSRPLCPYPQVARYKGTGDVNEAGNWECGNR